MMSAMLPSRSSRDATSKGDRRCRSLAVHAVVVLAILVLGGFAPVTARAVAADETPAPEEVPPSGADIPVEPTENVGEVAGAAASLPGEEPGAEGNPPPEEPDWEVRPYRVLARVAFADRQTLDRDFRARARQAILRRVAGLYGPLWELAVEEDVQGAALGLPGLERLNADEMTARYLPSPYDKVMQLCVTRAGPLYELAGREWDRSTQTLGPSVGRRMVDRRQVVEQCALLLVDLFRPVARIDSAEATTAELRVRGGELLSPESLVALFEEGETLVPSFRYLDRDKVVRQIQTVPWTYLQVQSVERSRLICTIESAYPSPISGARRRVELVAIGARPRFEATELALLPRVPPFQPLVGLRVEVFSQRPVPNEPWPEHLSLMSGREGTVTIPVDRAQPLRFVYVFSGDAVLAQTPMLVGAESATSIQLPDDGPRLAVEGQLIQIQGDLIDLIARRTVQMARAISLAKQGGDWETVDELLADLGTQAQPGLFRSRIVAAREPALAQAQRNRDRSAEKRISGMCRDLQELVDKYLDEDKLRVVREEIDELRQLDASTPGKTRPRAR